MLPQQGCRSVKRRPEKAKASESVYMPASSLSSGSAGPPKAKAQEPSSGSAGPKAKAEEPSAGSTSAAAPKAKAAPPRTAEELVQGFRERFGLAARKQAKKSLAPESMSVPTKRTLLLPTCT